MPKFSQLLSGRAKNFFFTLNPLACMFVYKSQYVKSIEVYFKVSIVSSNQIRSHLGYLLFVNVPTPGPCPSTLALLKGPSLVVTLGHGGWDGGRAGSQYCRGARPLGGCSWRRGCCGWLGPAEQLARGPLSAGPCRRLVLLGGAPGMTVVRRVLARAGAWQGAHLGACSGSGAGRRAPRGAGKGQICETGWAFPGRPRKPHWVVGLCPKAAGGR